MGISNVQRRIAFMVRARKRPALAAVAPDVTSFHTCRALLQDVDQAWRQYEENCALLGTAPLESFKSVLASNSPTCLLSGEGIDDNAIVRVRHKLSARGIKHP